MHNIIKRSTSPISSAIGRNNMWFAVNDSVNPTATSDWYNGYTPMPIFRGYTLYIHKASNGPVIYNCPDDSSLLLTVQKLGAAVFTLQTALNWIASQPNMICVNKNYGSIATSQQVLLVDSDFTPSFPLTGNYLYDVSPTQANGLLVNGVSFDPTYRSMEFDGLNDYINLGNSSALGVVGDMSVCAFVRFANFTNYNGIIARTNGNTPAPYDYYSTVSTGILYLFIGDGSSYDFSYSNSAPATGRWQFVAFTLTGSQVDHYLNGSTNGTSYVDPGVMSNMGDATLIGSRNDFFTKMLGGIRSVQMYNRGLTYAEVLRNYYGSSIVIDNLTTFLDAGNLVSSNRGTTTTVYNLVGGASIGTLVNGTQFDSNEVGGCWYFDGFNDALTLSSPISLSSSNPWTVSMWVRAGSFTSGFGSLLSTNNGAGPVLTCFGVTDGFISYQNYTGSWLYANGNTRLDSAGYTWYYLTWANSSNTMTMYVNGIQDSEPFTSTGGSVNSIGRNWYESFLGRIASVKIYNSRLTAEQIQRNFDEQVTRYRS